MREFTRTDLCGCCEGPAPGTPAIIVNRPGLSAIAYRVGTFSTFRQSMLAAIADRPELARLTTREGDDHAITLLELWAAVGDVLTFYQERMANEAFLRTAVHRDSVLRLARLLDYHLRPGLGARTRVAFTLDDGATLTIPIGLKLMSVPGPDETPQFFETVEAVDADARLNRVRVFPVPHPSAPFAQGTTTAPLVARASPLGAGDRLVLYDAAHLEEKGVVSVTAADTGVRLTWAPAVQSAHFDGRAAHAAKYARQVRFFGHNAPESFPRYDPGRRDPTTGRWDPPPAWQNVPIPRDLGSEVTEYPLDSRYEDVKPGTPLLVDTATVPDPVRLVTVVETRQKNVTLGPLGDTVTHVTVARALAGAPVAVSRGVDRLDVLARSATDSALFLEWTGTSWNAWDHLGGLLTSELAVAAAGASRLDAFVRGTDNALYHRWREGVSAPWQPAGYLWERLGGALTSRPCAVARGADRVDVFVRGPDLAVYHRWWDGGAWSPAGHQWRRLGGLATSAPVAVSGAASRLDVFVRGPDAALWHRWWDGAAWHPASDEWERIGGSITPDLAAIARAPDRLDVLARGSDGTLWHAWWDGALWHSASRGGDLVGRPSIASWGPDRMDVFARGKDDALWHLGWDGTNWSSWASLGGLLASDPAAVSWGANRVDVFARGADLGLRRRAWAGAWLPWESLGLGIGPIADRRATRVYPLDPPRIEFRDHDYAEAIAGSRVTVPLDRLTTVARGRTIILQADTGSPHVARVTAALPVPATFGECPDHLAIDFTPPLPASLPTASAVLLGNVAAATHGETVADEILGDGDGASAFQRFTLLRPPLTHLKTSRTPRGEAQLTVLVNGERWIEAESLYGRTSTARVYTARQADDGTSILQFGDGVAGARLPSGRGNVRATYRQGAGLAGRVRAGQLSILLARPPGLKAATNPAPAEGGDDPEPLGRARTNAPTTVTTFGRAVALADFEALATSAGEIAKARAAWVWRGLEKAIHLTVAGPGGTAFSPEALALIHAGFDAVRDPNHSLLLGNVCRVPVRVVATLAVDPRFVRDEVLEAARTALTAFFSFDGMALARAVHRSDVYAVLQGVRGVAAVDLDHFHFKGAPSWTPQELASRGATAHPVQRHLRIFDARPAAQAVLDPAVRACFPGPRPDVLPAEQACAEATDLLLGATGGIA